MFYLARATGLLGECYCRGFLGTLLSDIQNIGVSCKLLIDLKCLIYVICLQCALLSEDSIQRRAHGAFFYWVFVLCAFGWVYKESFSLVLPLFMASFVVGFRPLGVVLYCMLAVFHFSFREFLGKA